MSASVTLVLEQFDDLEFDEVLPLLRPLVKEAGVCCLHELEAAVTGFFTPAVEIEEARREESSLSMEPLVNSLCFTCSKGLDDHVFVHRVVLRPNQSTSSFYLRASVLKDAFWIFARSDGSSFRAVSSDDVVDPIFMVL